MTKPSTNYTFRQLLLLAIFFFSGFAALIYQVVWQRWLVLYTGISSVSISLIVSAFMAGIGLGYLVGGQLADKGGKHRPVLLFIIAEIGIGTFALLSKNIIYDWLYQSNAVASSSTLQLYSILFLVLLFPTFLMGVSLPVLSKAFQLRNAENQANYISLLYFVNTLGAAVGAFVTAFVLIRWLGFERAVGLGALLNYLCATIAGVVYWREKSELPQQDSEEVVAKNEFSWNQNFIYWIAQYTLSGFMAICFEIVWFRMLETMMKSIAVTFSIILSIYLATMAVGTYFGVWYAPRYKGDKVKLFLKAQYILYAYTVGSIVILLWLVKDVSLFAFLKEYFRSYETTFSAKISLFTILFIPLFLMSVPTFLMGFSFTISQIIIQDKFEEVGRKVGWLQFMNIVGSTIGAWFATLLGFNLLGTALTIQVVAVLGLVYVGVLYKRNYQPRTTLLLMAALLIGLITLIPRNDKFWLTVSGMDNPNDFIFRENDTALSIVKIEGNQRFVFINGLGQSVLPYHTDDIHIALGALPVLIHPNPIHSAIIGLGSGSTLYSAAGRSAMQQIDCFEVIEGQPDVLKEYVAKTQDNSVGDILHDARVKIIVKDGRYALHQSDKKYDIIEADALRPRSSFSGNLYSVEYFELLKSRLKEGGYAVTWKATDRIKNGMMAVFPYVYQIADFMIIGSMQPIAIDANQIKERLRNDFTKNHYQKAQINIESIAAKMLQDVQTLQAGTLTTSIKVNRDMWPKDEYEFSGIWRKLQIE